MAATKKKASLKRANFPRKAIPCAAGATDDEQGRHYSELVTSPELAAYRAICAAEGAKSVGELIDAPTMIETLRAQSAAVNRNDMAQAESMLISQATALQTLFSRLTERAMSNDTIAPFEANMRMALRAQAQCRATIETLAAIKNPPVVIARQANVTTGPQQINNCAGSTSHAGEIENEQNKLSGDRRELRQDASPPGNAGAANPPLEAMEAIDRAEVGRREGARSEERL